MNNEFVEPVRIWDVRTGELKRDFAAENIHGRPMALSPDGSILATGGKSVQLWDVRTGKKLRELFGHLKRTQSIAFSADGRLLVGGGSYGTTNVWEVATRPAPGHAVRVPEKRDRKPARTIGWPITPDGYYDGSPGIERYLAWRVGDELVTAKTLGAQLHCADRVESALQIGAQQPSSR